MVFLVIHRYSISLHYLQYIHKNTVWVHVHDNNLTEKYLNTDNTLHSDAHAGWLSDLLCFVFSLFSWGIKEKCGWKTWRLGGGQCRMFETWEKKLDGNTMVICHTTSKIQEDKIHLSGQRPCQSIRLHGSGFDHWDTGSRVGHLWRGEMCYGG